MPPAARARARLHHWCRVALGSPGQGADVPGDRPISPLPLDRARSRDRRPRECRGCRVRPPARPLQGAGRACNRQERSHLRRSAALVCPHLVCSHARLLCQPPRPPSCEHWQCRWRHPTPQRCLGRLLGPSSCQPHAVTGPPPAAPSSQQAEIDRFGLGKKVRGKKNLVLSAFN